MREKEREREEAAFHVMFVFCLAYSVYRLNPIEYCYYSTTLYVLLYRTTVGSIAFAIHFENNNSLYWLCCLSVWGRNGRNRFVEACHDCCSGPPSTLSSSKEWSPPPPPPPNNHAAFTVLFDPKGEKNHFRRCSAELLYSKPTYAAVRASSLPLIDSL